MAWDIAKQERVFLLALVGILLLDLSEILYLRQAISNDEGFTCCANLECSSSFPDYYFPSDVSIVDGECQAEAWDQWCIQSSSISGGDTSSPLRCSADQGTGSFDVFPDSSTISSYSEAYKFICGPYDASFPSKNLGTEYNTKRSKDNMKEYLLYKIVALIIMFILTFTQMSFNVVKWKQWIMKTIKVIRYVSLIVSIVVSVNIYLLYRNGFDYSDCEEIYEDDGDSLKLCNMLSELCPLGFLFVSANEANLNVPGLLSIITSAISLLMVVAGWFIKRRKRRRDERAVQPSEEELELNQTQETKETKATPTPPAQSGGKEKYVKHEV